VLATAMTRHHVIERQVVAALAAVLAGVVVALKDLLARQLHHRTRPLDVIDEPDHRRRLQDEALARDDVAVLLDHRRLLLREQHHSTPHVAHVQRLEVEVEDQHIRVDDRHVPILR